MNSSGVLCFFSTLSSFLLRPPVFSLSIGSGACVLVARSIFTVGAKRCRRTEVLIRTQISIRLRILTQLAPNVAVCQTVPLHGSIVPARLPLQNEVCPLHPQRAVRSPSVPTDMQIFSVSTERCLPFSRGGLRWSSSQQHVQSVSAHLRASTEREPITSSGLLRTPRVETHHYGSLVRAMVLGHVSRHLVPKIDIFASCSTSSLWAT